MLNFFTQLLDWLYFKKCCFCKKTKENSSFCTSCYEKIEYIPLNSVYIEEQAPVYCVCFYKGVVKDLIKFVKYYKKKELAFYIAKIMFDFMTKVFEKNQDFLIIPVPSHKNRIRKRGFNHMDLVAKHLGKMSNSKINLNLLKRIKDTKPQFNLHIEEREKNLMNAFLVDLKEYKNETILILDDIVTTGSTIREIIKTLRNNGVEKIVVLSLSKTELY